MPKDEASCYLHAF